MRRALGVVIVVAALVSAGCSGGLAAPSQFVTETFSGTIGVGGSQTHAFTVTRNGELNITVRSAVPNVTFGLTLGQAAGGQCAVGGGGTLVAQNSQYNGSLTPGSYCVIVYDVGALQGNVTLQYTLAVTHS